MMNNLVVVPGQLFTTIGIDEAVIENINKQCLSLKINGIADKEGYKKVHEARMIYKTHRVKIEKHGKSLRDAVTVYNRDVIKEEKRLIALLEPGESHLAAEEKAVDDALEAIKQEVARKEAERIQKRIERLEGYGMGLRAGMFTLLTVNLPEPLVKAATDEQFEKFCAEVQGAVDAEHKRLADEAAAKKAEEDRLEAERQRIAAEEARIKAEQEAERQRLEAVRLENERIERERLAANAEEERKKRIHESLEREAREKKEAELRAEAKRIADEKAEWTRIKAEAVAEEERKKQKAIDDARHAEEVEKAKKEAAEKALKDAAEKAEREAKEKTDREEKERIAAAKKEARRPDKERLLAFAGNDLFIPEMKTLEGKAIIFEFKTEYEIAVANLRRKAEAL